MQRTGDISEASGIVWSRQTPGSLTRQVEMTMAIMRILPALRFVRDRSACPPPLGIPAGAGGRQRAPH
jgi:hypothetical protein